MEGQGLCTDNRAGTAEMPLKIGRSKRDPLSRTSVLLRRLKPVRLIQQLKHRALYLHRLNRFHCVSSQ